MKKRAYYLSNQSIFSIVKYTKESDSYLVNPKAETTISFIRGKNKVSIPNQDI